ncbi:MAG: pyridoxal-dependent decarboxylase [Pseudomonadota bacterium]
MRALMVRALDAHAAARQAFHETDPPFIDATTQGGAAYTETMKGLQDNLDALSKALRSSTPMTSYRNQSHMNWDITMPGALGYFAGMLYNNNNVAPEASPVTTTLELQAGRDLCHMLGYGADPAPWGHITCDGSIANAESMWAARNLRYQAAALARAIRLEKDLHPARPIPVVKGDGTQPLLLDLEPWDLVNLPNGEILDLPRRMIADYGITDAQVRRALDTYSVQAMGLAAFQQDVLQGLHLGVVLVPATAHYSWNKGVAILGLGARALRPIAVDVDARMSVPALRAALEDCLQNKIPVIQLVTVAGSTAESAVDPVADVVAARDAYVARNLSMTLHTDAAWGGYFTSLLHAPKDGNDTVTPIEKLSPHVMAALGAIRHTDTVTIDPHKSGYIPYPAGALCYRDTRMIYLVAHRAPVVDHSDDVPSAGSYGIEGSKPGAAAAGVALSHATIPLDKSGYGEILGRCAWNAKRFYIGVNTLAERNDPFFVIPVKQLPSEAAGKTEAEVEVERKKLKKLRNITNAAAQQMMVDDKDLAKLFAKIGPDLTVFSYAINFINDDGTPNTDLTRMNALNDGIFSALSVEKVKVKDTPPQVDMLVTSTLLSPELYGPAFTDSMMTRAKLKRADTDRGAAIRVLISTMMNPFVTDTVATDDYNGNFLPVLMSILRQTVLDARIDILSKGI